MDIEPGLESTQGRQLDLRRLNSGCTAVIFYEARGHTEDNLELKESCGLAVERGWLGDRFEVLGIADVEGLDVGPVGAVVRAAVRAVAARHGTELWLDFHGVTKRPPLSLDGCRGSSVAIVDPAGNVVFREHGRLDAVALARFFDALGASIGIGADAAAEMVRTA